MGSRQQLSGFSCLFSQRPFFRVRQIRQLVERIAGLGFISVIMLTQQLDHSTVLEQPNAALDGRAAGDSHLTTPRRTSMVTSVGILPNARRGLSTLRSHTYLWCVPCTRTP